MNMERGGEKRKPTEALNSSSKRPKAEGEASSSNFEQELATLAAKCEQHAKWQRPSLPAINPKKDTITFQQLDLDHYIGEYKYSSQSCFICTVMNF